MTLALKDGVATGLELRGELTPTALRTRDKKKIRQRHCSGYRQRGLPDNGLTQTHRQDAQERQIRRDVPTLAIRLVSLKATPLPPLVHGQSI